MRTLTDAQISVLRLSDRPSGVKKGSLHSDDWRRLDALESRGLVSYWQGVYRITDAGRTVLPST